MLLHVVCVCVCVCYVRARARTGVCGCDKLIACRHSSNAAPLEQTKLILTHIRADTGLGCLHTTQLPDITYVLKEGSYTLTAEDYVVFGEGYMGDQNCVTGFAPLDVAAPLGPLWILGDIFLRKYYTRFHRARAQVGFAPAA